MPGGGVDGEDGDFESVADGDSPAGSLADNAAGFSIDLPPVVGEVVEADESVDHELGDLDEEAAVGHAGDDAGEVVADFRFEEVQNCEGFEVAFGVLGLPLGKAAVVANLAQLVG